MFKMDFFLLTRKRKIVHETNESALTENANPQRQQVPQMLWKEACVSPEKYWVDCSTHLVSSRWGCSPPCPSCAFGLASSRDSCGSGSALQGSAWGPGGLSVEHRPQLGVPPVSHGSPPGREGSARGWAPGASSPAHCSGNVSREECLNHSTPEHLF